MEGPNAMSDTRVYVENTDKVWTTKYNHQKRPDPQYRTKNVIPKDKLITKQNRTFTTDTSQANLNAHIVKQTREKATQGRATPKSTDSEDGSELAQTQFKVANGELAPLSQKAKKSANANASDGQPVKKTVYYAKQ